MRREIITCDVCGAEKKEANHWFLSMHSVCGEDSKVSGPHIVPWNDFVAGQRNGKCEHICGLACLHKRIEQWASKS